MPENTRSSELLDEALVDMVDKHFPKGECKERGAAMVLLSEFLRWHASKVEEARQERLLEWLGEQDLLDAQKFFGMIVYRYMMQPTNADKITVTLHNFSTKDKVLGDMEISAALQSKEGEKQI